MSHRRSSPRREPKSISPVEVYDAYDLDKNWASLVAVVNAPVLPKFTTDFRTFNNAGMKISNRFFQECRLGVACRRKKESPMDWLIKQGQERIRQMMAESSKTCPQLLAFKTHPASQFPPYRVVELLKILGRALTVTVESLQVFDPYCGWGDRCVAAVASPLAPSRRYQFMALKLYCCRIAGTSSHSRAW